MIDYYHIKNVIFLTSPDTTVPSSSFLSIHFASCLWLVLTSTLMKLGITVTYQYKYQIVNIPSCFKALKYSCFILSASSSFLNSSGSIGAGVDFAPAGKQTSQSLDFACEFLYHEK